MLRMCKKVDLGLVGGVAGVGGGLASGGLFDSIRTASGPLYSNSKAAAVVETNSPQHHESHVVGSENFREYNRMIQAAEQAMLAVTQQRRQQSRPHHQQDLAMRQNLNDCQLWYKSLEQQLKPNALQLGSPKSWSQTGASSSMGVAGPGWPELMPEESSTGGGAYATTLGRGDSSSISSDSGKRSQQLLASRFEGTNSLSHSVYGSFPLSFSID